MGNCLKTVTSHDDISLLRDSAPTARESSNELAAQAAGLEAVGLGLGLGQLDARGGGGSNQVGVFSLDPRSSAFEGQQSSQQLFYPSPNVSRPIHQLTEDEQVKIAQRIGLIQHLPTGKYDGCKRNRECVICMIDFIIGDAVRFLPCMHIYHTKCIDDWLMRSFTCPSCMEPVDAALLSTYQTD